MNSKYFVWIGVSVFVIVLVAGGGLGYYYWKHRIDYNNPPVGSYPGYRLWGTNPVPSKAFPAASTADCKAKLPSDMDAYTFMKSAKECYPLIRPWGPVGTPPRTNFLQQDSNWDTGNLTPPK